MRKRLGLFLAGMLLLQVPAQAQQVVRVNRPYILIDVASRENIHVGEVYRLYRWEGQTAVVTGKIEALVFRAEHCAFKITEENSNNKIKAGDWLLRPDEALPQALAGPAEESGAIDPMMNAAPQAELRSSRRNRHWLSWLTIGAGVVAGGYAYHNWDQAEAASEIEPISAEHYARLVDDVRRYDKNTNFFSGLSGGMIALGVVHYFLTRNTPEIQAGPVAIAPVSSKSNLGVGVKLALR